jgi:hypothetical protein
MLTGARRDHLRCRARTLITVILAQATRSRSHPPGVVLAGRGVFSVVVYAAARRRTFGFAIGVFVFSVTTALVIGDDPKVSVIVPTVEVVAVLAALAMIRSLQVKAFAAIQLAPTLSAIAAQGHGILTDLYLRPGRQTGSRPPRCRRCAGSSPDHPATTRPGPAAACGWQCRHRASDRHSGARPAAGEVDKHHDQDHPR